MSLVESQENITLYDIFRKTRLGHQAVLTEPALPETVRSLLWRCNGFTPTKELFAGSEGRDGIVEAARWLLKQQLIERMPATAR